MDDGKGESVNAVYGYTQFLLDLLDKQPERISVAFDEVQSIGLRGATGIQKFLQESEALVRMFGQITLINCDVPMDVSAGDFAVTPQPLDQLLKFCDELNFATGIRHRIEKYCKNHG